MVAWLSDWLRDIIAIILLAVFVELLLPNKAMQRYARLVVGLFILLTILSPILKLMQSDIGEKLDEGMKQWSESAMTREVQMTGLNQITRDAEAMSEKRTLEAAKLTERTLEATIRTELLEQTKAPVEEVDAILKWVTHSGKQMPYISQITVTLQAASESTNSTGDETAIEIVKPVIVEIEIESSGNQDSQLSDQDVDTKKKQDQNQGRAKSKWSEADAPTASAIRELITRGWGSRGATLW